MDIVRSIGADRVIDYTQEDFTRSEQRYDLMLDIAGNRAWSAYRRVLNPKATCVAVGARTVSHLVTVCLASVGGSRKVVLFLTKMNKADLVVLQDLLYVPVALVLYLALKGVNRNAMLLATAFVGLFIVLDLAVTWTNYASLLTLSSNYAAAANDAQRVAYVAAANYASAVLASHLEAVYAIVVLSFGILLIGLVMLKGIFNKITASVGLVTGVLGIVSIAGWNVTIIMNAIFATVWLLLVGYRLYRLGQ